MKNENMKQTVPADVQKQHRENKQAFQEKEKKRKSSAALDKLVCSEIYKIFPDLEEIWELQPDSDNPDLREVLDGIVAVLKYFSAHPRVLKSIQEGLLR